MSESAVEITRAVDEAAALTHPMRAMAVTLECGHLRLMAKVHTAMGVGAQTTCFVCPDRPSRLVCKVEETGALHESWRPS